MHNERTVFSSVFNDLHYEFFFAILDGIFHINAIGRAAQCCSLRALSTPSFDPI